MEAVDAVWSYFHRSTGNPIVCMPTGSGKSLVLAEICKRAIGEFPTTRIVVTTHVQELIQQDVQKLVAHWPQAHLGIYSASLHRKQTQPPIVVGGIQSMYKKARDFGHRDLCIVDEAQLIPHADDGMYRTFIEGLKEKNPYMKVIGLTATPYRLGGGLLTVGENKLFDSICYDVDVLRLIDEGFLSPLVTESSDTQYDTSGVKSRGGEFVNSDLSSTIEAADATTVSAVNEIVERGRSRRAWVVFCTSIKHATTVLGLMRARGVSAGMITSESSQSDRSRVVGQFQRGEIRCLINVMVLTTGFDAPHIDLIAILRPTQSPGLYVQVCGRGMRIFPGKHNCIAQGSLVLTDKGLVPIEDVTIDMLVWDGDCFVRHDGAILRGEREVITYAGLTATADHRVWTKEGWKTLRECAEQQAPIAVTGDGRTPLRTSEGHFCGDQASWSQCADDGKVHGLRDGGLEGSAPAQDRRGGLSVVCSSKTSAEMAHGKADRREAEVRESERPEVRELRRQGDQVQLQEPAVRMSLDHGEHRPAQGDADRSHRQRWALRAGQPSMVDVGAEPCAHAKTEAVSACSSTSFGSSTREVRGLDAEQHVLARDDVGGDREAVVGTIMQAKRRVWDILNCGPFHRFTVSGRLVHNCLVLDYGGNIERHGPINSIRPPKPPKGSGEAPMKVCPSCKAENYAGCLQCPECGHEYPAHEIDIETAASRSAVIARSARDVIPVSKVTYRRHVKEGKPDSVRVDYYGGLQMVASEWVCLEHFGRTALKAQDWVRRRLAPTADEPKNTGDMLRAAQQGWLLEPKGVEVMAGDKKRSWREVVGYVFDDIGMADAQLVKPVAASGVVPIDEPRDVAFESEDVDLVDEIWGDVN